MDVPLENLTLLKVGELARRTGKTTRALHLYEELGLVTPVRSKGGFRLYSERAVKRIEWIQKLQDMGFSLNEIRSFVKVWEQGETAPKAWERVRGIFEERLRQTRDTIQRLTRLVDDLQDSLAYLESCRSCEPSRSQCECTSCGAHGHEGQAPLLVEGMSMEETSSAEPGGSTSTESRSQSR